MPTNPVRINATRASMSVNHPQQNSVFLKGDAAALTRFAAHLNIPVQNVFIDTQPDDFTHIERRENSLSGGRIDGDFDYIFDIMIWDRTAEAFYADLDHLSSQGMSLATDLPDDQDTPFAATLFHNGQRRKVDIFEDKLPPATFFQTRHLLYYIANPSPPTLWQRVKAVSTKTRIQN